MNDNNPLKNNMKFNGKQKEMKTNSYKDANGYSRSNSYKNEKKSGSFNQDLWGSNSTTYPTKQSIRTWEEHQHARK